MKPGQKAKPTRIKELQGTLRPGRQRNEPDVAPGIPAKPAWLKGIGGRCWDKIAPLLADNGLLTKLDGMALSGLCDYYAIWVEAREIVHREGLTMVNAKNDTEYQHAVLGIMNRAWREVMKLACQFGMTPSARAGLAIDHAKADDDPMAVLLAGMKNRN
jgi:P27 family predicted phage terminase small subunit